MSVNNPSLVEIQDEGISQGAITGINFTGAGVTTSVLGFLGTVVIPGGGGATATRVAVTFPYPARHTQEITVVDATVSPTSKILVWISGLADSNAASSMEDSLIPQAIAGAGNFLLVINSRTPIAGAASFDYMVLA